MQDRYFGDVGDFGKYGLLRVICGGSKTSPRLSLAIIWYLVPDEDHNDDGRHISYLTKPGYRDCDPQLYDTLRRLLIETRCDRAVYHVERSNLFAGNTRYYDQPISYEGLRQTPDSTLRITRLEHRARWLQAAVAVCRDRDVIFLDPDNGLEVKSVPKPAPKAPKYVYWDELASFAKLEKTLVVYHHVNRTEPAASQIAKKTEEIRRRCPAATQILPILFRRGSLRVLFVIPAPAHYHLVRSRIEEMTAGPWSKHVSLHAAT